MPQIFAHRLRRQVNRRGQRRPIGSVSLRHPMLRINRSICPRVSCEGAYIEVNVTSDEHTVVLAVRDHGLGIPADHLPHVTERFYRVDRSRGTAGNGRGLSIVTAIAKLHDGRLELSDAAPGLLARLVLPRRQAPI